MSSHFYLFFATSLIDSIIQEHDVRFYLSYDIKHARFWRKNVITYSLCTKQCYGRHNVSRKSVNGYNCMERSVACY